MKEILEILNENWRSLTELFGSIAIIVGLFYKRKSDKKKIEIENEEKIKDLSSKVELLKDEKKETHETFIERVSNHRLIDNIVSELKKVMNADRVAVYLTENYEMGVGIDIFDDIKSDLIWITNESHNSSIVGEKKQYGKIVMGMMSSIIRGIEKANGMLVINDTNSVDDDDLRAILELANVKSAAEGGLYRSSSRHRKSYLTGAVVVAFVMEKHEFTDKEINTIKANCLAISALIENEYLRANE